MSVTVVITTAVKTVSAKTLLEVILASVWVGMKEMDTTAQVSVL
jgi:hypothetical protein